MSANRLKIAVVVGHNSRAQGADAPTPMGQSEFVFNSKVAAAMKRLAGDYDLDVEIFFREAASSYSAEIDTVYAAVTRSGARASIELHFNDFNSASAQGTETLCSTSRNSRNLAAGVQASMLKHLGRRDRGIKVKSKTQRGGRSLYAGKPPAVLVEPFFGSNPEDNRAAAKLGATGFARMYLEGLSQYVPK